MFGYKRQVSLAYDAAVDKARQELKKQGFGVLTQIDVKATLKEKLNVDFDKYIILGACNPPFAYKAISHERDIGLLMPCNVIVYEQDGRTFVAATEPVKLLGLSGNEGLGETAKQVEDRLQAVINAI